MWRFSWWDVLREESLNVVGPEAILIFLDLLLSVVVLDATKWPMRYRNFGNTVDSPILSGYSVEESSSSPPSLIDLTIRSSNWVSVTEFVVVTVVVVVVAVVRASVTSFDSVRVCGVWVVLNFFSGFVIIRFLVLTMQRRIERFLTVFASVSGFVISPFFAELVAGITIACECEE